jgi:putative ABC transport system permease protein
MIGRTITLDQEQYTIVGVMPTDFQFPNDCEVWTPLAFDAEGLRLEDKTIGSGLEVIARLKPGVKLEQAQTEMDLIARKLEKEHPETNNGRDVKLIALRESRIKKGNKLEIQLRKSAK